MLDNVRNRPEGTWGHMTMGHSCGLIAAVQFFFVYAC